MCRLPLLFIILLFAVLPLQAQDTQQILDEIVAEYTEADGPALVVQVTTPDETWTSTAGSADGERPVRADDRFRIGSMSKTFVAVAALMLVEDGVFDLDDPARDWLPDEVIERIANADTVTIRQLLSMRSGIPDYLAVEAFWEAVEADPTREWTALEALEYAYDQDALFEPDEQFSYSNSNYLLLQLVLENAAETPLHSLLRERILDPLELENTYTQISETLPGAFVNGYEDRDGDETLDDVTDLNDGAGLGDGGLISNAEDLTTFYRALLQDQTLLNPESIDLMLDFQMDDGAAYTLGLNAWETPVGDAWGHAGGVVGYLCIGVYLPEYETTLIVLSASTQFAPEELALAVAEAVLE